MMEAEMKLIRTLSTRYAFPPANNVIDLEADTEPFFYCPYQ